jgi:hypothetical protein
LIKYFDNSIFKAIKNYVPARTSVSTGIVIKQHLLERNRRRPVQLSNVTKIAVTPSGGLNTPIVRENLELTSSIDEISGSFSGGAGGVMDVYNLRGLSTNKDALLNSITANINDGDDGVYEGVSFDAGAGGIQGVIANVIISGNELVSITITSPGFDIFIGDELVINGDFCNSSGEIIFVLQRDAFAAYSLSPSIVNQSWSNNIPTVLGLTTIVENTQKEFYNGEISGTILTATTQSLLNDPSFDALLNNVSGSRLNSYLMKVEYEKGIVTASNNSQILDRTAQRAAVPDSNYTSKRSILPRYEGSKASSANYNHYTSASSGAEFRDGSTGSWNGDSSYGKTAAIDKNPIYFAHFKSSFYNFSIFNTIDYLIDQLIEVPFEDIQGQNIEPKVIKVEGDNTKLQDVVSTFEKNRELSEVYEKDIFRGVDYSLNSLDKLKITNPGSKYITAVTSQLNTTQVSNTASFKRFEREAFGVTLPAADVYSTFNFFYENNDTLLATGSGFLTLSGSISNNLVLYSENINSLIEINTPDINVYTGYAGPFLSIIHNYNYSLKNGIHNDNAANPLEFTAGVHSGINPNNPNNYLRFNPISSSLPQYENNNEPFLIERGDEIRTAYISGSVTYTQTFIVTQVGFNYYPSGSTDNNFNFFTNAFIPRTGSFQGEGGFDIYLYDKIYVYPDPSTLINQIPSGSITTFTHRKRKNADNTINVTSTPPPGSRGASTLSGGGFIIPNDLTKTQKRNVQTLINQLKAKNSFRDDDTV